MKKLSVLLSIAISLLGLTNRATAQCKPCPERFMVTDSGCTNIMVIGQPAQPPAPIIYFATDSIRACQGSKITYNVSPNFGGCNYPGITYTYTISNGTLVNSSGSQFTIQWGNAATGSVTINYTIPTGPGSEHCSGSFSIFVILFPKPVPAFSIAPNPACLNNQPICFNAAASVGAVNYFWDFGDGFQGTGVNPCHTYSLPGTYIVTLIAAGGPFGGSGQPGPPCPACVDSIKQTVTIYSLPGPPIDSCHGTVCAGEESKYCTPVPPGCGTYVWTVVGGTITSGQGTPCITVTWGSGNPQGSVTLQIIGCPTYCTQGTTVSVPIIPATTTITGTDTACINTSSTYSLPAWPGTSYSWNLSGGGTITGNNTNTNSISINWATAGTYTITCNYYDSAKECGGVGTLNVVVLPLASITGNNTFCAGASTTLTTTGFTSSWSISPAGASITPSGSSATVTSNTPGTYTVTATPTSPAACNAPTYTVTVLPKPILTPITGQDSICKGQTYIYAVGSNTVGTFNWTVNNGTFVPIGSFNDSIQVTWNNSGGPYTISVTQTGSVSGCVSDPVNFTAFPYPTPVISGATSVCADATITYTITNIGNHPFNWSVSPGNFGTIIFGQGTNQVQIKWHGSNSPGSSNTVYLKVGFCQDDSIAIIINEPVLPVITATGTLCGGGVNLSVAGTGSYSWSCTEHPITPTQPTTLSSLTGLTLPGHYTVTISNYNGTGCTVSATYFVPDIGRPTASISANNVLDYCLPALPNMNLVAAYTAGYQFQWYQAPSSPIGGLTTNPVLPINFLTTSGSYTFYCVVTLNGCSVTSNAITINITNCPGGGTNPGCSGGIGISGITGCNPFTFSLFATAPAGGTIVPGTTTIAYPYSSLLSTNGNTTVTFDSVGYKQIRICADIAIPGGGTTRCCKDTVVLVTVASKFLANESCGVVTLTDLSTVIFPNTIGSYAWTNGSNPGNLPVPISSANFNNAALQNPVDTLKVSGSYIITQTITSGACTVSSMDTLNVVVPNASFSAANSCVGTPIGLAALGGFTSYLWDFGDAATSYTQTTSHAYASPGVFTILLKVTNSNGCWDTVSQVVTISPAPACTLTVTGPTTFCAGDSAVLQSCAGLTGYQWYNNGNAIPLATSQTYAALQTGNYYCTALNANNCLVMSDTVAVLVNAAPPANIITSGSKCLGGSFTVSVPNCATCTYFWTNNGNPVPGSSSSLTFTIGPAAIGPHTFVVTVTNLATGCTATGTATVTFYNPPTVSISVLPNVPLLCSNNPYLLTATTSASSPAWAWNYNNINFVISSTNSVTATAAGTYNVFVTDGITGCTATASKVVDPSPDLALFPAGCDTLCDSSRVFLPLGSINNNLSGYTITWYDNAPPFVNVVGSGPILLLGSPLSPGNHSLSVIVISPNGCADTSNNYKIFVKPCAGCDCDSSKWGPLTWEYAPNDLPVIASKNANNVNSNANNNNNNNKPKEIICGKDLGKIDCTKPILIKGSFLCNPSSCDTLVKYTLTGPVTGTGYLPFSTSGLPAGSYVLILEGKCGDSICKVCDIPFTITCDTLTNCCAKSHWAEPLTWNAGTETSPFAVIIGTPIDCKKSNFIISDELGNCKTPVTVTGTFICGSNCPPKVVFNLFNTISNTLVATSTGSLVIPLSLPNGSYSVTVYAYCGDKICDSCVFKFTKKCDDCCTNSHWVEGPTWQTGGDDPAGGGGISTPIICGKSEFSINDAIGNCKTPITISGIYACGGNCPPKVVYNLYNTISNTLVSTSTGSLVIPVSLPNGSYSVTIYAYCGDKICDSCKFTFTKKCDDCCTNSHWVQAPTWQTGGDDPVGGGGISTPIICGKSVFNINDALGNCNTPVTISGTYACGSNCPPKVVYNLYNTITNTLVTSVTGSLVIPVSLPNGSYSVTIYAYCGDKICDSCKFTIIKKCTPCNCDQGKPISVSITTNEVTKKYNCGAKLPVIDCKSNVVLNAGYTCKPANCPAALTYQLIGPYGTTTGTLPITLSALAPGTYTIILNAYCNNILCKECKFTFTVRCDGLPPKECCPYPITVKSSVPTYQLMENSAAAIVNQQFGFTGLTGVQLSEVKAEVLSYNLSSNFENECLGCKSKPFTWASVQSAGNIGAVVPKITLFGGFTTPVFNPTGTAVYQNPREVIWNNGSPFLLTGPIGINFIVPPPSLIDCCVLSGKICVKFTFRDINCRECEVIACFEFNISKDMKVNYVRQ